jgi:hypothetical protein
MARICAEPVTLEELIRALPRLVLPAGFHTDVLNPRSGVKKVVLPGSRALAQIRDRKDLRLGRQRLEETQPFIRKPHPSRITVVSKPVRSGSSADALGSHLYTLEKALTFLRAIDVPRDRLVLTLAPSTLKRVLSMRGSCRKVDPAAPSREARRSLLASVSRLFHPRGQVKVRLVGRERASVITEADLLGDDIVVALPPLGLAHDPVNRMRLRARHAVLETNYLTLEFQEPPSVEGWSGLTEGEAYDRYVEIVNVQFERLQRLYRSL